MYCRDGRELLTKCGRDMSQKTFKTSIVRNDTLVVEIAVELPPKGHYNVQQINSVELQFLFHVV